MPASEQHAPRTPFDTPFWQMVVLISLGTTLLGVTILTAILIFDPLRFIPYTFKSPTALLLAFAGTAVYALLIALALRERRAAIGVMAAAILIRILAYFIWGPVGFPGTADPSANVNIASNILAGRGIVLTSFEPFAPTVFKALYPPLYPVLLAGSWFVVGDGSAAVFVLNSVVDGAAAYTVFLLGRELFGTKTGTAAAALYLLWPTAIFLSLTAQKETTAVLVSMQCVLAFMRLRNTMSWKECIRLGIATALLALAQPSWLPVVGCLGIFLLPTIGFARTFLIAGRSIPIFVAILLPWWVRNYYLFDSFVPLTTSYGINLLYVATNDFVALASYYRTPGATEIGGADRGWNMAWEVIQSDPLRYLKTRVIDVAYAWGLNTFPGDLLRGTAPPYRSDMRLYYGLQLTHLVTVMFATVGAYYCRRKSTWLTVCCLAVFSHFLIFQVWFEFSQRHRYLLIPILVLFIAEGLRAKFEGRKPLPAPKQ